MTLDEPADACPAEYSGTFRVDMASDSGYEFELNLKVLPLEIPAPNTWHFQLDLWQHPERVLALHNQAHPNAPIERWSPEHF